MIAQEPPVSILVIEDNRADADLLKYRLLEAAQFEFRIVQFSRLFDAMSALGSDRFDIALLDVHLPDAVGLTGIQRLHERAPGLPVIVLTGSSDSDLGVQAVRQGADDYFNKDALSGEQLARGIQYAIERGRVRAQMRELVHRNADAMIVVDRLGNCVLVNPAAEALFGRRAQELVGEHFDFAVEPGRVTEIDVVHPMSGPRDGEMRVSEIVWEGKPAFLASIRDITERKRIHELERRLIQSGRMVALGQLAAGVAHEVNNPAGFILANTSILGEHMARLRAAFATLRLYAQSKGMAGLAELVESVTERYEVQGALRDAEEIVKENLEGIERICSVVRDLRAFARDDRDEIELVELNEVVDAACNIAANEIRHRARLVRDIEPVPPIAADRARLGQVVLNLLMNAAQAIEAGHADANEIRVDVRATGDHVLLAVSDTGCGIEEENRDRIFEPFFTTKTRDRGTGLGLCSCTEIVRMHGGLIRLTSTVGTGSRFEVVLPIHTGLEVTGSGKDAKSPFPDEARARVLLIEDEPMVRKAFRRILEPRHEVIEAVGGAEGLAILAQDTAFHVIFCDLMMPQIDGPMVYEALRDKAPELLARLVFISGGAFTARTKSFLASVGSLVLEKPIAPAAVRDVVERLSAFSAGEPAFTMAKTA